MKQLLNIDTLVITGYTGTEEIQLSEGDNNTPIEIFKGIYTTQNIKLLANCLTLRDPKGFTGEIKRILMLLHIARETGCSTDVVYHKDFNKNSYASVYGYRTTFKLLLGTKHNQIEIKKITVPNNTVDSYEIKDYLLKQLEDFEELEVKVKNINSKIEDLFNKY